jgi:hypothetical protein
MSEFLGDGIMHFLDVPFFYGMANEHQAVTDKSMPVGAIPLSQDCSRPHLRMGLTHIALFCNVPAMQRLLPQVLIVPPRHSLLRDLHGLIFKTCMA